MDPLLEQALATLRGTWPDLTRALVAWARMAPVVALVPAFGLRAVIAPVRVGLALALGVAVSPALDAGGDGGPLTALRLLREALGGLPVALTAAAALHVATMVGGLVDTLRADRAGSLVPGLPEGTTPLGALLGIVVAVAFLQSGGATELCTLAAAPPPSGLPGAALALERGIAIAVAAATPLVVVAVVVEVAFALTARAASPAYVTPVLAPARTLVLLGATALLLDRLVALTALVAGGAQSGTR